MAKKISETIDRAIRKEFAGQNNAGLRKAIREQIESGRSVMAIARKFALTKVRGLPSLKAVAAVVAQEQAEWVEIWRADQSWWDIHGEEIELADDFVPAALDAAFPEGHEDRYLNDCNECFACTVEDAGPNNLIMKGDVCVSHGIGSDKIFLRAK